MAIVSCQVVEHMSSLDRSIAEAVEWLRENQKPEGYWMGWLESNACMEAEWLLAFHFLGIDDQAKKRGLVNAILKSQRSDGSWEVYYNAPRGDINTTVECYAALRCAGFPAEHEALKAAREWIFRHGGINSVRVFTQYWLALIGEWPWESTPTLPPEIIFLPGWLPFSIYEFASWARATIVPLTVLSARRPAKPLPENCRLDELFPEGRRSVRPKLDRPKNFFSWDSLFYWADWLMNRYVTFPFHPGRETAIKLCIEWIIRRQEADGAWGGIQPPWVYGLMALYNEGYDLDHPIMKRGLEALDAPHWSYWVGDSLHIQASNSPVWDTVLTMVALLDCGEDVNSSRMLQKALDWLLEQQILDCYGDWSVKVRGVESGGWPFEMANRYYPDVDDTAVAMTVLARVLKKLDGDSRQISRALARAEKWMRRMQSSNGGWGAFDKDNMNLLVTKIPFCDFGEVLDPPSVDVTAHVVEALAYLGYTRRDPSVAKALRYIRSEQEEDGSWFGRWGVNYIYGTSAVLQALRAIGENMSQPYVRRAAKWLVQHQNEDGGWGETPASYMDKRLRGVGESTPSQTAWALLGLMSVENEDYNDAIERGIRFLIKCQKDGTWDEPQYTATGFPGYGHGGRITSGGFDETLDQGIELGRGFMINYNMYRHYFPLMALGRARRYFEKRG